MADPEHLEILKQGVEVWNKWRGEHSEIRPDLSRADLSRAYLIEAKLSDADLSGADLSRAKLRGADLRWAHLSGAHLSGAHLSRADLGKANLSGADLREAKLRWANLSEAHLSDADLRDANLREADLRGAELNRAILNDADFTGVILGNTIYSDNDLSQIKGLEEAEHFGPSSIGIETLYKSAGKIPEAFLRGCGVPESFIVQMHALVAATQPIEFYSCFISYSHKDEDFARRLFSRMREANLRVWYAPEEMKGGQKLHEQIFSAIQVHDKLLLVLSENSLKSEWVATEIQRARKVEREEHRRKLFPIRLVDFDAIAKWEHFDADSGKDLGVELREYFIPDFSNWKDHDSFEKAFERLLRDLKAEEKKA